MVAMNAVRLFFERIGSTKPLRMAKPLKLGREVHTAEQSDRTLHVIGTTLLASCFIESEG